MIDLKIREQKIKVLTPREAGYAIQLTNKVLLDVRPTSERNKVLPSFWYKCVCVCVCVHACVCIWFLCFYVFD